MESIAQVLGAGRTGLRASAIEKVKEPDPVPCKFCGAMRRYPKYIIANMPFYGTFLEPCVCAEGKADYERERAEEKAQQEAFEKEKEEKKRSERIRMIIGESGMGERFLRRTFNTFLVDENNSSAHSKAKRFADDFDKMLPRRGEPEPGKNGLYICGDPGTGKTHLAAAIANQLIGEGRQVVCMTMIELLNNIRRSFSQGGGRDAVSLYKTAPLLIIDDMGKEPPSEWAVSTVYDIINARYEAYLPLIITTNYSSEELIGRMTPRGTRDDTTARATVDRLREMCRGAALEGESRRG